MLRAALRRVRIIPDDVTELNWDWSQDRHGLSAADGVRLLELAAASISNAAALPQPAGDRRSDQWLLAVSERVYHGVFRILIATALVLLIVGPMLQGLVLLPSSGFEAATPGFRWVWRAMLWVSRTAGLVFALLLALDLVRGAIARNTEALRVTFRRGALLFLQPFVLLLTVPVSAELGSWVLAAIRVIGPVAIGLLVVNLIVSPLYGVTEEVTLSAGRTLAYAVAIATVAALQILARRFWIGGPLKIVLDIALYMGSPKYRTELQGKLDAQVRNLQLRSSEIVIVAHSLGSIIAIDSLVNSPVWRETDSVRLITLGSPIRRFFIRFFPQYLFPPSVRETARLAATRLREFSWINIHRPLDYVGTSLGDAGALSADRSTGQFRRRVLSSHSGYWNDDVVLGLLKNELNDARPVDRPAPPRHRASSYVTPHATEATAAAHVSRLAYPAGLAAVVLATAFAATTFERSRTIWYAGIDAEITELQREGISTVADVTHHETQEGDPEYPITVHHFVFRVPGRPGEAPLQMREADSRGRYVRLFDAEVLAAYVRADCLSVEPIPSWQILRARATAPCRRSAIPFVYSPSRPDSFLLPTFPARSTGRADRVFETIWMVVLSGLISLLSFLVVFAAGVPLLRLFLGLKAWPLETGAEVTPPQRT